MKGDMIMAKKSISVTLEESTIESLKHIAENEMRSVSNLIDYIVFQYSKSLKNSPTSKINSSINFGENVVINDFKETRKALYNNVVFDEADKLYIEELGGKTE